METYIYGGVIFCGLFLFIGIVLKLSSSKKTVRKNTENQKRIIKLTDVNGKIFSFDPFDNFLIYGGANSGKTKSLGKPILEEYIRNNFAGLVYDYKDMDYTKTLMRLMNKYKNEYPYKLYIINFIDLDLTSRVNPLKPSIVDSDVFLQILGDIFDASAPRDNKVDFFYMAAKGLFRGVGLFFYDKYPQYCTLPHISLFTCTAGKEFIYALLMTNGSEYRSLASAFCDNYGTEAFGNILSTATNQLGILAQNRKINYVLTGNDFDYNLIDFENPKLVSICNSFQIESLLSPVISALFSLSSRSFTMKNEIPFFYLINRGNYERRKQKFNENTTSIYFRYKRNHSDIWRTSSYYSGCVGLYFQQNNNRFFWRYNF